MNPRLILVLILGLALFLLALGIGMILTRKTRARNTARELCKRATSAIGAARCAKACSCLEALAASRLPDLVVEVWAELEGPLLEAVPDCPPDTKLRLAKSLERCHDIIEHRATQRSMMDLRRSLDV